MWCHWVLAQENLVMEGFPRTTDICGVGTQEKDWYPRIVKG